MIKSVVSVYSTSDSEEATRSDEANNEERAGRTGIVTEQKNEGAVTTDGLAAAANASLAPDATHARAAAGDERAASRAGEQAKQSVSGLHGINQRTWQATAEDSSLLPRAERMRKASIDMLDEAADDPSLRFVLVALTLFVGFLLIFFAGTMFD